jgi:hypothetical protein
VRTADLFSRLAKYRPRPLKSSLEDFVTELVGYALENEPAISRAVGNFLLSSTNEAPTRDFKVCTQEYTQSDNVKLKGWRLDLVFRGSDGCILIVENKVNADPDRDQLLRYCRYARERTRHGQPTWVVLVSRDIAHLAVDDKRLLKSQCWAEVMTRVAEVPIPKRRDRRFVKSLLEFMKEQGMGALGDLTAADVATLARYKTAQRSWEGFVGKTEHLLARVKSRIGTTLPQLPHLGEVKDLDHKDDWRGFGWYDPPKPCNKPTEDRQFWYFVGVNFGVDNEWWFPPRKENEPELVTYVATWPNESKFVRLRRLLETRLPEVARGGVEVMPSSDPGKGGLFLVRREPLRMLVEKGNATARAEKALLEAHKIVSARPLLTLFELYKKGFREA